MSEDELLMGGKNTLLFLPISSKIDENEAIRTIKLFSEDCQKTGFHVIAETVFIGSAEETARFLKKSSAKSDILTVWCFRVLLALMRIPKCLRR